MSSQAKPNDFLHRYVLRSGFARQARERVRQTARFGARSPLHDIKALFPGPVTTVFDVGANIGYVTHDFRKAFPSARIFAFEPTPETFATLQSNLAGDARVTCINKAVADHDGTATLHIDSETHRGGSNSLLEHNQQFRTLVGSADHFVAIEVPTVRLDSFCAAEAIDHIDLLKLDIEGAEPQAIAGATGLLEKSAIDVVLSEVRLVAAHEGGVLLHEYIGLLDQFGYRPYGIYRFAESPLGQSLWGDAVFLSPAFRDRLIAIHGERDCGFAP